MMVDERGHRYTHLFTVRVWVEQVTQNRTEIRGRAQHVLSGDVRHFRTWRELTPSFDVTLQELESPHSVLRDDMET